jgi:O-antigen ligase
MILDFNAKKYFLIPIYLLGTASGFLWSKYVLNEQSPIVSLVIPAAILFLVFSLININFGLVSLIIFSVLGSDFGFDIIGLPKLYAVELMLILLSLLLIVKRIYTKNFSIVQNSINRPIFILFAWSVIAVAGSLIIGTTDTSDFVHQADNILLWSFAFIVFLIVSNEVKAERTIKKFVYLIIISSIPYLVFYFLKLMFVDEFAIGYEHRVFSSFLGVFSGMYLMIIFILLLNHIIYIRQYRSFMTVLLTIVFFALIATFWRTSLISTAVVTVTSISFRFRRLALLLSLILAIAFVYITGTGEMDLTTQRENVLHEVHESESSPLMQGRFARIVLFKDAVNIIKEHPIFGIGMNMYGEYTALNYMDRRIFEIRPMTSAHNEYLQVMVSIGILGLPLFLWLLYATFKETSFLVKNTRDCFKKYLGLSFLNILIGIVIYSFGFQSILNTFSDGYFQSLSSSVYFWIILGLVVAANNIIKTEEINANGLR